jgi:hypothetical protein
MTRRLFSRTPGSEAVATYCIDGAVADMLSSEVVDRLVRSCPKKDGVRTLKRMLHDVCAELFCPSSGDVDVVAIIDEVHPVSLLRTRLMMYT